MTTLVLSFVLAQSEMNFPLFTPMHGTLGKKTWGSWESSLGPGSSFLTTASFLFQGGPDHVLSLYFGYDTRGEAMCEKYLRTLLAHDDHSARRDVLCKVIRATYVGETSDSVYMVLTPTERRNAAARVRRELASTPPGGFPQMLSLGLCAYLEDENLENCLGTLRRLSPAEKGTGRRVAANIVAVRKQMVVVPKVPEDAQRPLFLR